MVRLGDRTIKKEDVLDALLQNDQFLTVNILKRYMQDKGHKTHYYTARKRLEELANEKLLEEHEHVTGKNYKVKWWRYNENSGRLNDNR